MKKDLGREIVLASAYAVLAFVFFVPLSLHFADSVAFVGDGLGTVYLVSEMARRLFQDPTHLFEAGIAFPHAHASLFEAHRLLIAALAAPVLWATGNPILATNAVTLIAYTFNGWSARHLARRLGIDDPPAFVAGCLFAFNTYALNEEARVNVVFLGFLPLALESLLAYMESGERRDAWKAAGFMLAQAYTENYYLVYGAMLFAFVIVLYLFSRFRVSLKRIFGLALPALVAGALFLPVLLAYLGMDRQFDYRRESPRTMGLEHYVAPLPSNLIYGSMGSTVRGQQLAAHFIGFGTLILAVVALAATARRRRSNSAPTGLLPPTRWVPAAWGLALLFVLLSVGRNVQWRDVFLMPGPFGFLYDHVSLFQRLRIPERLSLIAMLFLGLLAARGLALVPWRGLRLALCVFLPAEHLSFTPGQVRLPLGSDVPAVYAFLRTDSARAIAEAPIHGEGLIRMESLDMYYELYHHKPIVAAYLSFTPALTSVLRRVVSEFPDLEAVDVLRRVGVDTVVVHGGRDGGDAMKARAESEPARSELQIVGTFANVAKVTTESGADLGDAGVDTVYRIQPRPLEPAAAAATGHRVLDSMWAYRSNAGAARAVADGDAGTMWISEDPIRGGEFIEIGFRGQGIPVSGIVIPVSRFQVIPSAFVIEGRDEEGAWRVLSVFDGAHRRQLVDGLLASPGGAPLSFAIGEAATLYGIRLRATPGARSFDGWRLSELEVLSPDK